MAVKDYNVDPDLNTTIEGINIAEGCPPSGINNAIRQLMADVKAEQDVRGEEWATKSAEQDAAIAEAKSSADEKVSALESLLRDLINDERSNLEAQIQKAVPAGTVMAFAANSTPDGFLLCNGAAVSRSTYAALFSAIGTTYGAGDGSSTFALPNLTDKFIQGSGTAGTVKAAGLPDITGSLRGIILQSGEGIVTGAFKPVAAGTLTLQNQNTNVAVDAQISFSAQRSNSIHGASTTVQPPALTMRYYIKY